METTPLQSATLAPVLPAGDVRADLRAHAIALVAAHGCAVLGQDAADPATRDAGVATSLMEAYRRTGDGGVFDCLVRWAMPHLTARVRCRLRGLGPLCEPQEVLQDVLVNIYRYPDRFLASRAGAFAAWSTTIVDNAIRRRLRRTRRALDVTLQAPEVLCERADLSVLEPDLAAADHEACAATVAAFTLVLQAYLRAYATLSSRERFVLDQVELAGVRYAEVARRMAVRADTVKMIVFRARKRVLERAGEVLAAPRHRAASVRVSA